MLDDSAVQLIRIWELRAILRTLKRSLLSKLKYYGSLSSSNITPDGGP